MSKTTQGKTFEEIAAKFLKRRKYKILETNARISHKEIDIICEKNGVVHFIEVKGRTSETFGNVTETISSKKKENLIIGAQLWLQEKDLTEKDWQIDFIGILDNKEKQEITHIENAINRL